MENEVDSTKVLSLTERMKLATETKTPTKTIVTPVTNVITKPTELKKNGSGWNFKDDFETVPETTTANTTTTTAQNGTVAPEQKRLTQAMKQASARTAVGMLDFSQKLILKPIVNYKFKKKFTAVEINRIDVVDGANKATLSDEDLKIRNKWDKLMKKRDKTIEGIPLTEVEEKDLEKIFYNYFDVKEKELDPGYLVAFGIINTLGKRAIDIFID